ncbi:hypothetical protein L484_018884 [Morus notabilis]|uniref:Uncharacterized protein n=1 Tax=Morus notabilis TaxID=981085 RepID=W9R060_9ROSA|nr:hypothetical protein L484_018884 [Morus notabilis]
MAAAISAPQKLRIANHQPLLPNLSFSSHTRLRRKSKLGPAPKRWISAQGKKRERRIKNVAKPL